MLPAPAQAAPLCIEDRGESSPGQPLGTQAVAVNGRVCLPISAARTPEQPKGTWSQARGRPGHGVMQGLHGRGRQGCKGSVGSRPGASMEPRWPGPGICTRAVSWQDPSPPQPGHTRTDTAHQGSAGHLAILPPSPQERTPGGPNSPTSAGPRANSQGRTGAGRALGHISHQGRTAPGPQLTQL